MLTAERLREVLRYDPDSGLFWWRATGPGRRRNKLAGTIMRTHAREYAQVMIDGRNYLAHRLAWMYEHGEWPDGDLDHADRDGTNNRLSNLRLATRQQNRANSKASGRSGVKGAYRRYNGRWQARIRANGSLKNLGHFATAEDAGNAYAEAAREAFGEFARPSA